MITDLTVSNRFNRKKKKQKERGHCYYRILS